jgi:hypothetical protein
MTNTAAGWTLADAAEWLNPPITLEQLQLIVRALGIQRTGTRNHQHAGRPVATYDPAELIRLHAAIASWLLPWAVQPETGTHAANPKTPALHRRGSSHSPGCASLLDFAGKYT